VCVDFELFDKSGKQMVKTRQQIAGETHGFYAGILSMAPEICRVNRFFPQNGLFLACHAGWSGGIYDFDFKPPGPLPCVGTRKDTDNPSSTPLVAVQLTWLPIVGELQTIKASVPASSIKLFDGWNNEFHQFLIVFVQSQAFPAFF
jgi:hypothetical protein